MRRRAPLHNSEWQDSALASDKSEPVDEKKVVTVEQFSKEYFELAAEDDGRWSEFLSVPEPLLIQIHDKVYRIVPPNDAE